MLYKYYIMVCYVKYIVKHVNGLQQRHHIITIMHNDLVTAVMHSACRIVFNAS